MKRECFIYLWSVLSMVGVMFLGACSDDEDRAEISYTIDGVSQKVTLHSAIFQSEQYGDYEGRAINVTAFTNENQLLTVTISNWSFQNPPSNCVLTGEYDVSFDYENTDNPNEGCLNVGDGEHLCPGGLVALVIGSNFYASAFGESHDGVLQITACGGGKISGTFSTQVSTGFESKMVTGSFRNLRVLSL